MLVTLLPLHDLQSLPRSLSAYEFQAAPAFWCFSWAATFRHEWHCYLCGSITRVTNISVGQIAVLFKVFLIPVWPPVWSSGQSSWLQNKDVLCFLWGTNWICICYAVESRPHLWSSGQSSRIQNWGVLSFLWGTNWICICYVEKSRPHLWSSGQSSWLQNKDVLCFLWGTNWIYICFVEEIRPPLWSSGQSFWLQNWDVLCFLWGTNSTSRPSSAWTVPAEPLVPFQAEQSRILVSCYGAYSGWRITEEI
jgi:hypothetical protein